jgi:hypothetical protein
MWRSRINLERVAIRARWATRNLRRQCQGLRVIPSLLPFTCRRA